jgi:hypothetical protein
MSLRFDNGDKPIDDQRAPEFYKLQVGNPGSAAPSVTKASALPDCKYLKRIRRTVLDFGRQRSKMASNKINLQAARTLDFRLVEIHLPG